MFPCKKKCMGGQIHHHYRLWLLPQRLNGDQLLPSHFAFSWVPLLLNRWSVCNEIEKQLREQERLFSIEKCCTLSSTWEGRRLMYAGARAMKILSLCSSRGGPRLSCKWKVRLHKCKKALTLYGGRHLGSKKVTCHISQSIFITEQLAQQKKEFLAVGAIRTSPHSHSPEVVPFYWSSISSCPAHTRLLLHK